MPIKLLLWFPFLFIFMSCTNTSETESATIATPPDSLCDSACDSAPLTFPVVSAQGGFGAVTTYGDVHSPEFSNGGACNYGQTTILNYAAAHVHVKPGDHKGLWQKGTRCGDCLKVRVGSESGYKTTIVRIVDKCPDSYCGIDLGGNPAKMLMGSQPGRYEGEWEWVDCSEGDAVFDGDPVLVTKDGTNAWWSLVQVRNGPSSVNTIAWSNPTEGTRGTFAWATEAENFFKVPETVLKSTDSIHLEIEYRSGQTDTLILQGTALGEEFARFPL